jgi:flagella synthesis protein FlgN
LLTALTAERDALGNFVALLEREQGLLVANQTDQLIGLAEQKSANAISLSELAESRRSLLHHDIPELSIASIHAWLEKHNAQGLAVWQGIRVLAERAQQLNRTNGELIQMKLRHKQQALSVLGKAVNKASLYGPDGQTSFSPGSGRSLGSG